MSTVTKAISSVEFHVNARQANAALQSIQEEAKKCREQVEDLQRQAAKGVTTVKVDGMDVDIQKRIREVKALQKTWESAAQSQIKGAKAFDELWKNARMGTIESMNGAQIKAGINASKPIYDRLRLGDAEDRMKAQAIKDMQDQGQKVLNQLKTTTDQIIKQIADGETIAADVLEREARNLKSIMDLLPPLSQEWKDYNLQYQAINQQIERQTVLERQLRGEIVTREDAIRVINAANREATQQEIAQEEQRAKAAREAAEAKASEADQYRTTVEQKQSEIFATNDLIAAKRREIDAHHESAAAAKEAADKARDAAYKDRKQAEQEARNQQDAYNKQKKNRDDAAKDVEKFRKELEKLGEQDEKRAGVQQKLTDAETRLADEDRKLGAEQDKLTDKQTKATEAATKHKQAIQGVKDVMEENRKTGQRLGEEMGQLTKQHKQQTEELAEASEKMTDAEKESNRHIKTEQEARLRIQQLNNQSIEQLTASLRVFEEENRRINDPGNQRWQENERYIGQLNLRLEELKKQSAELRREPVLDMMTERMGNIRNLSADALAETMRFWQSMAAGAENGSHKLAVYEGNLKVIAEEERQRRSDADKTQVRTLFGDLSKKGTDEIRAAIEAGRRLIDTYDSGSPAAQRLAQAIVDAEEHLKKYGVEAERAARREAAAVEEAAQKRREQDNLMRQQLDQGTALSESALKAQQQYWQRLIDDPKTAKESLAGYRYELERTIDLQKQQTNATRDKYAARLSMPNQFANLSEAELRQSIEASKQLLSTYKSGSAEAGQLAKNILAAENHIKAYGLEAQRAAQKEAQAVADAEQKRRDADTTMRKQLYNTKDLTESALKAQEQYWKRLIDDPKTAAASLDRYRKDLERVHLLQEQMEQQRSAAALEQRRMAGEIVTVDDAMKKAVTKTEDAARAYKARQDKESWEKLRESAEQRAEQARLNVASTENEIRATQQSIDAKKQELSIIDQEIAKRKDLEEALAENKQMRMELAGAQDEVSAKRGVVFTEKGEWLNRNDEVIKATVRIDELKENLQGASNLKEQHKILQDLKVAEDELTQAKVKAEEQNKKLEKATEELRAAEDKTKSIQESLNKQVGGRNFEKEEEELNELKDRHYDLSDAIESEEKKHSELTERLKQEQEARSASANDVKWAQENETKAAIEMAQAQNMSQEAIEQSINILENAHKKTSELSPEYDRQADAIGILKQRLAEMKGEWMSLAQAEELASKAGTSGFFATQQQMQQATQAIERQRDTIIATIREKRNLGQATKAEEDQLADLTKKLRSLKFEQDNVNMSQEKMQTLIETPANAVNLDELRAAIKRADGQLRQMQQSLGENSSEYKRYAEQVRNAKNVLKEMEGQAKASATAWEKAFSRLKTYVVMYMGFNEAWQKITGTMGDMLELSDKMGEVMKTTGFTADQVARLSDNLKDLDTRASMVKLMELSSIAGSIGLKTQEQVEGFTDAANQLMVALPEMGSEAARTLMKIADATGDLEKNGGDVRETLERVGSTIIALRANSAAAAGPITDFVSRVGAVGAQAGISIDQIAALGATVDALGGRVEMSATALSRMIPAIRNNSFEVAKAIGMAEQDLKKMTAMEQMVAIFKALRDSVKQFDTSTDEGMNAMADKVEQMLGNSASMQEVMRTLNQQGARAGIVFGLLSQNVDKLEEQLTTATDAYRDNTALMEEYNKMNDTAAARWERLKNQLEEFFVTADNTSWLADIISGLRVLVDIITEEGPIGRFFRWSLVYLGMWQAGWTKTIGGALISLYQYIFATGKSTAATAADTAAKAANAAATEAQAVASGKAAVAQGRFNATMKANIVAAVATAVVALGFALYEYIKKAKAAARQMDVLADVEKKAREESVKERAELERLYKATQDQTKSMEERKKALKDMVGDKKYKQYYENLSNETELAKAAAGAYKELAAEIVKAAKARVYQEKIEELARKNVALEDKIEEDQQYVDDNAANYNRVKGNVDNSINPAGIFGGTAAAAAAYGDQRRQYLREYEKKQEDIIANQEEIKKNNETIGKMEKKLKDTGVKLGGNGGEGGSGDGGGGGGGTNLYGQYDRVTDPYSKWNGDDLVARRKEMLVRVRALANGADVQKVLSEDAKFISEAVRKNIKTTDQAIEWYNAERLKIQEALYNKHLTPTGDWLDPKKGAGNWRKQLQTDFDNYLRILDAYYTERKAHIEKAQAEEGLSEAETQRLTVENETVWRKHRMELQQIYLGKSADIAKDERQRIYNILAEQDEDSADMVEKQIAISINKLHLLAQKSEVEARKIETKLVKDIATDHYKQQNAVSKQMEAIEKIISEERPFDGITKNLRDNLSTMGVFFADFDKKRREVIERGEQPEDDMAERAKQTAKRLSLVLDSVPDAYRMTFDQLKEVIIKEGFGEWAKAIEGDEQLKLAMMAQIRKTYDQVQEAIRKEAALIKKHADNLWNDALTPDGKSMKNQFEAAISQLGLQADQVKRANSLIGAGVASDRVADRLVIQQMKVQLAMERARFALMHKIGEERIRQEQAVEESLRRQGKLEEAKRKHADIENMQKSLGLAISEEQKKVDEQRVAIQNQLEESQNRLYTSLREWADLLTSSLQGVFEASHAGDAEYYNERATLNLTGKGGPGAGTYVVIDDAGTSDATAHYEYLDERQALERQHEIEVQNAQAEAWKKLWDDINMKMSEQITDWMNAYLQNKATEDNTAELQKLQVKIDDEVGRIDGEIDATKANTDAIIANTEAILASRSDMGGTGIDTAIANGIGADMGIGSDGVPNALRAPVEEGVGSTDTAYSAPWQQPAQEQQTQGDGWLTPMMPLAPETDMEAFTAPWAAYAEMSNKTTKTVTENNKKQASSTSSMFAKMTAAANLYGVAYQAMSNDNLDTAQKFEMIALQAVGNAAIAGLQVALEGSTAQTAANLPAAASKASAEEGPIAGPILFAVLSALVGGLMGLATSKIAKSKSKIASITGANSGAGRLATGMLTYAKGNVNELTDPASLTPGRQYNVDGADGKTYRARYMGKGAKTHITKGPEFHLVGEAGREAIIDAKTTRLLQMNETGIWRDIQTLYNGGAISGLSTRRRRGTGVAAFADGNVGEFENMGGGNIAVNAAGGANTEQMIASLDRNSAIQEALLERLNQPIYAQNILYGPDGLPNVIAKLQKEAQRHGEKFL